MSRTLTRMALAAAALLGAVACSDNLTVPSYNSPTIAGVNADPNAVQFYATGVLHELRESFYEQTFGVGILGRESYYYFPTDPRFVTGYLIGQTVNGVRQLDPAGFASGNWYTHFRNIRNTVNLAALATSSKALSASQKASVTGFAQTIHGLTLWYLLVSRDTLGVPIATPADPAVPAPFVSRDAAFKYDLALLDSGATALQAAGSAQFPFALTSGFAGFDQPSTFLTFNRAVAARVANDYATKGCGTACYTQALADVSASFFTQPATVADMNIGVYNVYSSTAGDFLNFENNLADPNYLAHASAVTDAQTKANGALDDRSTRKVAQLSTPRPSPGSGVGIPADYYFSMYPSTTTPSRLISDEELLLIKAEAEYGTGNLGQALLDLNTVRTVSGGLAPLSGTTFATDPIGAILYERHFSLLNEGFRWNDARRFGRLNTLELDSNVDPTIRKHFVAPVQPIPTQECNARGNGPLKPPAGCP